MLLFFFIFKYIPGLATQFATDGLEGGKTYSLGLARLQDGEIG